MEQSKFFKYIRKQSEKYNGGFDIFYRPVFLNIGLKKELKELGKIQVR